MEQSEIDIAIIGSGLSGIAFARFYLEVHPKAVLSLFESDGCIGGVWSAARVFDDFWIQSPLRMTCFSDEPLEAPSHAPKSYDTCQAKYVTQYLEDYVDSHTYNGTPLRRRIRPNTTIQHVEKTASGWNLHIKGGTSQSVHCNKIAVAAGINSQPTLPRFLWQSELTVPVLHHRDFGTCSDAVLAASSPYKNVTILGGGKSAADMVYASLKAEKTVNWVIRNSGEGPGILMDPAATGRYRHAAEVGVTQSATVLSPSGFRPMAERARIAHQPITESDALKSKLYGADRRLKEWADYKGRKDALPCFKDLEPRASFFWSTGPIGYIQHHDFWDLVSHQVNVYRGEPSRMTMKAVTLDDGREVPTDALFCGTGWNAHYPFLSCEQTLKLGLPHHLPNDLSQEERLWSNLMEAADQQILSQHPILAKPPSDCASTGNMTPARLFQGIAPLTDPSIVFLGRCRTSANFLLAEAQAIWTTAYWNGHITLPLTEQARRDVAYMNAFSRRRYPTRGGDGVNFQRDLLWYTDTLLSEAGLTSHRKEWWKDPDAPFFASDLKDCRDEYIAKYGARRVG